MIDEAKRVAAELTDEEIAAAAGEQLPEHAAMSTIGCDPSEFGIIAVEGIGSADAAVPPPAEEM